MLFCRCFTIFLSASGSSFRSLTDGWLYSLVAWLAACEHPFQPLARSWASGGRADELTAIEIVNADILAAEPTALLANGRIACFVLLDAHEFNQPPRRGQTAFPY